MGGFCTTPCEFKRKWKRSERQGALESGGEGRPRLLLGLWIPESRDRVVSLCSSSVSLLPGHGCGSVNFLGFLGKLAASRPLLLVLSQHLLCVRPGW